MSATTTAKQGDAAVESSMNKANKVAIDTTSSWLDVAKRGLPAQSVAIAPEEAKSTTDKQNKQHHQQSLSENKKNTTSGNNRRKQRNNRRREQVYVAPPLQESDSSGSGNNKNVRSGGMLHVPLFVDLVRLHVCAHDPSSTVLYCLVPMLGDRLCDFHLVGKPAVLDSVLSVRLGALGNKQNRVWLEWNAAQVATSARTAGRYVVRVDAGATLRSIPTATRTGIAVNVTLSTAALAAAGVANGVGSLYLITRQQHVVANVALMSPCMRVIEGNTFRVYRSHAGHVYFTKASDEVVAQWRASRDHQTSLYGSANVGVDILPVSSGPMLPLMDVEPWGDATTVAPLPLISETTVATVSALLHHSGAAPTHEQLIALNMT